MIQHIEKSNTCKMSDFIIITVKLPKPTFQGAGKDSRTES